MEIESSSSTTEIAANSARIPGEDSDPVVPSSLGSGSDPQSDPSAFLVSSRTKSLAEELALVLPQELDPTEIVAFNEPFSGCGGHLFFYFCQLIEICFGWLRLKPRHRPSAAESLLRSSRLKQWY